MRRIGPKDTKPELVVRRLLHSMGYRFRLYRKDLPGRPDLVLPKYRTVVFVHGCFWHCHKGCKRAFKPKMRRLYWAEKLGKNIARDIRVQTALEDLGWRVLVVWECETNGERIAELKEKLRASLDC